MSIGILRNDYPERRCIVGKDISKFNFLGYNDIYKYKNKFFKKNGLVDFYSKPVFLPSTISGILTFNDIVNCKVPWATVYESIIPRHSYLLDFHHQDWFSRARNYSKDIHERIRHLNNGCCKKIFALSNNAYNIQKTFISSSPFYDSNYNDKLEIMHPPQEVPLDITPSFKDGKLRLTFIGKDFYRKGGAEVVLAINSLISDGQLHSNDIELTLIGDLSKKYNYIHKEFQDDNFFYESIENFIFKKDFIIHFTSLPHQEVMKFIINSDLGLLPSWSETYGYSVLEFQACDVPVITTDVRALAEINYSKSLIKAPYKNIFNEIEINSHKDKDITREAIISGIKQEVIKFFSGTKIANGFLRDSISTHHDPERYYKILYQSLGQ